jgi:Protein of unknown function (DUF1186)/SEC-C motif
MTPVATVDTATIIEQLSLAETFPRQALEAAAANRAELVPKFLREIDEYLEMSSEDRICVPTPLLYAFHLLAEWRETAAYRPLLALLRLPPDDVEMAIGDSTTETASRVIASVFDGDPQPIFDLIHDANTDEFIRWEMFSALTMLVLHEKLDRGCVVDFLRDCLTTLPQISHVVWIGWIDAITELGVVELKPSVQRAFENGFMQEDHDSYKDFETRLTSAIERPTWRENRHFKFFDDTVAEMSMWSFAREAPKHVDSEAFWEDQWHRLKSARIVEQPYSIPVTNSHRSVGRNDPCPCDSGKKYKKCCLN